MGSAIVALGALCIGLSYVQGLVRSAVHAYWLHANDNSNVKTYVYFAFIVGFATFRLWITLLILTYGLKQSYLRQRMA